MIKILKVVRIKNLLIVAATLYLMRYCIIQPLLQLKNLDLQLSSFYFFLLTLATVFITAAGYVINDYFDTRTDLVNRPQTVIIGRNLSRRTAILLHIFFNFLGVVFGTIVSFKIDKPILSLLFIGIVGILWFYSTTYKRQFLIGNLIVAILTATVPMITLLFELPRLYTVYWEMVTRFELKLGIITYWVGGYALFAFLLTLVREITKDIEDFEGDQAFGRNTIPVFLGKKTARTIAASLLLFTILSLVFLFAKYLNYLPSGKIDYYTLVFFLVGLVIPMFILLIELLTAEKKEDYHKASQINKLIMLSGLLYTILFKFLII
ncbi:MAG: geranylgeranylglycerol-phosphate geranylgeranyltransferase [Bacteroidales bacterium]|nr:geranylgeranylglycerol-phosphate geranylgeranyltransferase [Bacteroidales bacterium]